MPPPRATHKRGKEVGGFSEFLARTLSILRHSRGFFVTFVVCMGFTTTSAHTKLASRQTLYDRAVAARLILENLEGRGKYEGDVCMNSGIRFRSQDSSSNQERLFMKQ